MDEPGVITGIVCGYRSWIGLAVLLAWGAVCNGADEPMRKTDLNTPGTYRSGQWEYKHIITSPGSRSEGQKGMLFFAGKELTAAATGDYYETPWGKIEWVGEPATLWGVRGWFLRDQNRTGGRELPAPWLAEGCPVVEAMVLTDAETQATGVDKWIVDEVAKLGGKNVAVARSWFIAGTQAETITDTKLNGRLTLRAAAARDASTLTMICDGSKASTEAFERKDGATKVVRKVLGGLSGDVNYYLAFRVIKAAPEWPKPMDLGAESNGKEVVVKDSREIIITLPVERTSGLAWQVKRVQGDSPKGSSVVAVGTPQSVPANDLRTAHTEVLLKVVGTGKTLVELELKRSWETEKKAEKTFEVTLDVPAASKSK